MAWGFLAGFGAVMLALTVVRLIVGVMVARARRRELKRSVRARLRGYEERGVVGKVPRDALGRVVRDQRKV